MIKQMFAALLFHFCEIVFIFFLQILNRGLRKCLSLQKGSLLFETCDLSKQVGVFIVLQLLTVYETFMI